jgi:hypothetical protein
MVSLKEVLAGFRNETVDPSIKLERAERVNDLIQESIKLCMELNTSILAQKKSSS